MKLTLTTHEPPQFRVENDRLWTVHLEAVPGERGRFRAISETQYHCLNRPCTKRFTRSVERVKEIGTACPDCGCECEPVEYLVNVLEPHGNPRCACESYTTTRGTTCKHGHAALYLFGKLEAAAAAERQGGP